MSRQGNSGETVRKLVTWLAVGLAAVAGFALAKLVFGWALRLALFVLPSVITAVLVGWLTLKALRYFGRDSDPATR